jgi:hypothetical protein
MSSKKCRGLGNGVEDQERNNRTTSSGNEISRQNNKDSYIVQSDQFTPNGQTIACLFKDFIKPKLCFS